MSSWRRYSIYKRLIAVTILSFAVQAILMMGVTYARYRSGLTQADATFNALVSKSEQRIAGQFDSIRNIASSVGYSSDVQRYILNMTANERVENYQSIKYMFGLLISANPAVEAIYIANDHGVFLEQGGYPYMFEQFNVDYADQMDQMTFKGFFSRVYYKATERKNETPYCIFYLPINTLPSVVHPKDAQFYCAVLFDVAKLLEINTEETQSTEILIYDGKVLSSGRQPPITPELLSSVDAADSSIIAHADGKDYYMRSFELDVDAPLLYTFIAPMDTLMGDVKLYMQFSVMMIAVCLVVTVVLLASMRNRIIRPIRQMTEDMQRVTDASGIIRPTEAVELNGLSTGVNQMLHKLRDMQKQELIHQQERYQMSLEKTQAEMMGYRSQINPHFLFNTLECMCSMARYHGIAALEELTIAMADSFRYVLRAPDFAPLEQEIAHARNYMRIMDIRYPDRFHLQVNVPPEAMQMRVLSMLLQPLLENAVLHGFVDYDKDDPCTVRIDAHVHGDGLVIQVMDNGMGLCEKRLEQIREHMYSDSVNAERKHIALQNICRRLRFAYKGRGQIEIQSEEGRYTRLTIRIPINL